MTVERYNTPNHPRWDRRLNGDPTPATPPQPRDGRLSPRRDGRPTDGRPRAGPPLLVSRDTTDDETTIDLRNTAGRVWITVELPDHSLDDDDIHVSVSGASIRIQAGPSAAAPDGAEFDRTLTLGAPINPADVVVAYDDPVLSVIVPSETR